MFELALIDFGGVVAEEGFVEGLRQLALEQGLSPEVVMRAGWEAAWDSGFVLGRGDEAAFWKLTRDKSGLAGTDEALRERFLSGYVIRPFMLTLTDRLRQRGAKAAILSDQSWWLDELERRLGFARRFDRVFNSYYEGLSKRETAFFELALREMGAAPEKTLFIDDNAGNVSRAGSLGLTAVLYQDRPSFLEAIETLVPGLTRDLP